MRDVKSLALGIFVAAGSADEDVRRARRDALPRAPPLQEDAPALRRRDRADHGPARRGLRRLHDEGVRRVPRARPGRARRRGGRPPPRPHGGAGVHGRGRRGRARRHPRGDRRGARRAGRPPPRHVRAGALARATTSARRSSGPRRAWRRLTRATLAGRFREIFRPERTLVVAAGAIDPDRLVGLLERGRARRRRRRVPRRARAPARPARRALRRRDPARATSARRISSSGAPARLPWADPRVPGGVDRRRGPRRRRLVAPLAATCASARGLAYHVGSHLSLHRDGRPRAHQGRDAAEEPRAPRADDGPRPRAPAARRRQPDRARAGEEPVRGRGRARAGVHGRRAARRRARAWLSRGRPYETEEYLADVAKVTADDVDGGRAPPLGRRGPARPRRRGAAARRRRPRGSRAPSRTTSPGRPPRERPARRS